jgi:hypothetical protein
VITVQNPDRTGALLQEGDIRFELQDNPELKDAVDWLWQAREERFPDAEPRRYEPVSAPKAPKLEDTNT